MSRHSVGRGCLCSVPGGRGSSVWTGAGPRCRCLLVSRVAVRPHGPCQSLGVIAPGPGRALTLFWVVGLDLPGEEEEPAWTPHRTCPACPRPPPALWAFAFPPPSKDARPGQAGSGWNEPRAGGHPGERAGGCPRCAACLGAAGGLGQLVVAAEWTCEVGARSSRASPDHTACLSCSAEGAPQGSSSGASVWPRPCRCRPCSGRLGGGAFGVKGPVGGGLTSDTPLPSWSQVTWGCP